MRAPAVLLIPGWDDDQQAHYQAIARDIEARGWRCRTLNMPGTSASRERLETVSRADHLHDLLVAFDALAAAPQVDGEAIGVVGVSYGGYLCAHLCAMRPLRWLVLRAPAL